MSKCVFSASSKEDLTAMINEYYYSKNYIITDDNRIYNTAKEKFLDGMTVVYKRNRWRVERTEEWTMSNTECAKVFIEAIKTIAEKSENIDNLECYLENHFDVWTEKKAHTHQGLEYERKRFTERLQSF